MVPISGIPISAGTAIIVKIPPVISRVRRFNQEFVVVCVPENSVVWIVEKNGPACSGSPATDANPSSVAGSMSLKKDFVASVCLERHGVCEYPCGILTKRRQIVTIRLTVLLNDINRPLSRYIMIDSNI